MFLAQGTERALLIDTGMGISDLKSYIETLVKTPYEVVKEGDVVEVSFGTIGIYLNRRTISTPPLLWALAY